MKFSMMMCVLAALTMMTLFAGPSSATILLANGLHGGSGDVQNVLLDSATGNTAVGHLNQDTSVLVDFSSNETLVIPSQGQARIQAEDGALGYLSWELRDQSLGFSKLQFNINAGSNGQYSETFKFTFFDQFGTPFVFKDGDSITNNEILQLDRTGGNFFTAYCLDDQVIVKAIIEIDGITSLVFDDVKQVRLNPVTRDPVNPVPEPGTLILLGAGLAGLAKVRRKRS